MDTADFQMEEEMSMLGEATAAIHYFSTKRMERLWRDIWKPMQTVLLYVGNTIFRAS